MQKLGGMYIPRGLILVWGRPASPINLNASLTLVICEGQTKIDSAFQQNSS